MRALTILLPTLALALVVRGARADLPVTPPASPPPPSFEAASAPLGGERAETSWGWYGGLAIGPSVEPLGGGSELDRGCTDLGAATCATPVPLGGMLLVHAGLAKLPWGVELLLAGTGDLSRPSATYDGVPHEAHGNPLLSKPAREESFILVRGGGALLLRARHFWDGRRLRWTLAAGIGAAYKYMALEREVTGEGGLEDRPYFSRGTSYVSPAVSLDAAAMVRATPSLAVTFGVAMFAETAWSDTRSVADETRRLAGDGAVLPIATPAYRMASGLQWFLVPYVGLAFGP